MHDAALAAAARPTRYVILGLPMKPYSIGHDILLFNQGNPILSTEFDSLDKVDKRQAVIWAADICSQSWNEYGKIASTWWQRRKLKRVWGKWERFTNKLSD